MKSWNRWMWVAHFHPKRILLSTTSRKMPSEEKSDSFVLFFLNVLLPALLRSLYALTCIAKSYYQRNIRLRTPQGTLLWTVQSYAFPSFPFCPQWILCFHPWCCSFTWLPRMKFSFSPRSSRVKSEARKGKILSGELEVLKTHVQNTGQVQIHFRTLPLFEGIFVLQHPNSRYIITKQFMINP